MLRTRLVATNSIQCTLLRGVLLGIQRYLRDTSTAVAAETEACAAQYVEGDMATCSLKVCQVYKSAYEAHICTHIFIHRIQAVCIVHVVVASAVAILIAVIVVKILLLILSRCILLLLPRLEETTHDGRPRRTMAVENNGRGARSHVTVTIP